MTLEVEILTGRYKGDTAIVENYFSSLYNVRVAEGDKVSIRIDTTGAVSYTHLSARRTRLRILLFLKFMF